MGKEITETLPDKVVPIGTVRVHHGTKKYCTCKEIAYFINPEDREVRCALCDGLVDPYYALFQITAHGEQLMEEVGDLLEQKRHIENYKPHLVVIREIEKKYRTQKMIPCCPHCNKGFFLEEIGHWTNRRMEERRREKGNE